MKKDGKAPARNVDEYITGQPDFVQPKLQELRTLIRSIAPEAEETISYQMPAYKFNGPLVYFAGYQHHIGFYPTASGIAGFKKELSVYKGAKGSVQFPLDEPLPKALIKKIVLFRLKENKAKSK